MLKKTCIKLKLKWIKNMYDFMAYDEQIFLKCMTDRLISIRNKKSVATSLQSIDIYCNKAENNERKNFYSLDIEDVYCYMLI